QPRPCRGADERERRKVESQRPRPGALADHDVETEVLERRIQDLLDGAIHPMDLVHEQNVSRLEAREDGRHVALSLQGGAGDGAHPDVELLADDGRERGLAKPGRPHEQHVIQCLAPSLSSSEPDVDLLLRPLRPDEVGEPARSQGPLALFLSITEGRRQKPARGHAALPSDCTRSASRTRSSAGRSGSTCASACSASTSEYPSSTRASRATSSLVPPTAATGAAAMARSSSRTIRSAVFLPMPGIAWKRAESRRAIARASSSGGALETTARATLGPIPLTPRSWTKSERSAASANPYSWSASSRTWR